MLTPALAALLLAAAPPLLAQQTAEDPAPVGCPAPLLVNHRVAPGETLATIAQRYHLSTATLQGANPAIQKRPARAGDELVILPRDGVLYRPQPGEGFPQVAQRFRVSADVLFEANGCRVQAQMFVPGVRWQPPPPPPRPIVQKVYVPVVPSTPPILRLPPPPAVPPSTAPPAMPGRVKGRALRLPPPR